MNNVVALQPQRSLRDYSGAQLALIRKTVAADCNELEFDLYMEVARRVGLDPFRRQIYAVVYNKKDADKRKMAIITGIDGFRAVAARNRDYRPDDEEATIVYDADAKDPETNPLGIVKATVKAYKLGPNGEWHPVVATAHWDEFAPLKEEWAYDEAKGKRQPTGRFTLDATSNWRKMARVMICKVAEAQALRRGWPEDLSGIYAPEEMERSMVDITPSAEIEQHEQEKRLALVHAKDTVPIQWVAGEPIEAVPVGKIADKVAEFVGKSDSITQIEAWERTNTAGLREFWALHKSDALELKKVIEGRKTALAAE